ncbi:MAG: DUF1846 domain-containing protein [Clostridiaceae bacterium]|nr:DUF1846 domain-containing protein [Clostridiaceae bacterium]
MKKIGFDNALYMQKQTEQIRRRIEAFGNKLYLEFGGKLFDDYHAARVLPGFDVNAKVKLLQKFSDSAEIVFCINAGDIEKSKIRADFGITYERDLLRTIDAFRELGLYVNSVVVTQYANQPAAHAFRNMLEQRGVRTYTHYPIHGYPADIDFVVSEQGYGINDYIETTRPLVVVTAPGPCSGKLATCLSQLYHESRRGVKAGYAKFETFPIWNLPLKHPVNLAYEAATADLKDVNMIDPFHLEAYGEATVNYNRDIEVFPIVNTILTKITGNPHFYRSPTDMGVNMAGFGIIDDEVCREAARQEILRRYYQASCDYKFGRCDAETAQRVELLLKQLSMTPADRAVVEPACRRAAETGVPVLSIQLADGRIITGKASKLLGAPSSCVLNSVKVLAGLADELHLLSPVFLEPITRLKKDRLKSKDPTLNLSETLMTLSICAATNPTAELALSKLDGLRGCEAHSSCILSNNDERTLRKLGLNVTCEPEFSSDDLFSL